MIKLGISIFVIGLIGSLGFWLFVFSAHPVQDATKKINVVPKNSCKNSVQEEFITIQNMKFSPSFLSIKRCTKVTFINNDTIPHWPASDIHPTHGIYPEFDPKKPIQPGKKWYFVFEKKGTWNFHDHLHPTTYGMIEVQ